MRPTWEALQYIASFYDRMRLAYLMDPHADSL